jgi:ubiquinone/menaquinone biosynthesis C-methylase UbiE
MDRDDLLTPEGSRFVASLNDLAVELDERRLPVTSWYGALMRPKFEFSIKWVRSVGRRLTGRTNRLGPTAAINRGGASYESVPGISCDNQHPWFLYWEAFWVMVHGPDLTAGDRILDAGGTASLFSYHLASQGVETHSVDLNEKLADAGNETARAMNWNLYSHYMDMTDLKFDDAFFDHAYSICVLEHLDADSRQRALSEIARVLKPGGILSITFDYAAPGVSLADSGPNYEPKNLIRTPEEVHRHFLSSDYFETVGNPGFADNGKRYLVWPADPSNKYTFGALFLRRLS